MNHAHHHPSRSPAISVADRVNATSRAAVSRSFVFACRDRGTQWPYRLDISARMPTNRCALVKKVLEQRRRQ